MLVFVFLESLLSNNGQKGDLYSKKSMISIRYGIQKHFLKIKNIDVVDNDAFKPANLVFQAKLMKIKGEGNVC
jgi:predicted RNA-binding protein